MKKITQTFQKEGSCSTTFNIIQSHQRRRIEIQPPLSIVNDPFRIFVYKINKLYFLLFSFLNIWFGSGFHAFVKFRGIPERCAQFCRQGVCKERGGRVKGWEGVRIRSPHFPQSLDADRVARPNLQSCTLLQTIFLSQGRSVI